MEKAVVAYRAALEELTRDRVPLQWAGTQNNLGNALKALGEREPGTARLEEAVVAYRAALEERTRDRVPLQWAQTFGNQGAALVLLAERRGDDNMAAGAVEQLRTARDVMRNAGHPAADFYDARLRDAQSLRARLRSGEVPRRP